MAGRHDENIGTTKFGSSLMRHGSIENRNLNKILLGGLYTLGNGSSYFAGLTQTPANDAVSVAYNDNCAKGESTTTLGNLSNAVDSNQTVLQFLAIDINILNCHNRY